MSRNPQRMPIDDDLDGFTPYEEHGDKFDVPDELIPDGMVYQWCRAYNMGQEDRKNIANLQRNRWTFVPDDRPGHDILGGESTGVDHNGRKHPYEGFIVLEGLVLMERPKVIEDKARAMQRRDAKRNRDEKLASIRGVPLGHLGAEDGRRTVQFARHRDLSISEDADI